MLFFIPGLEQFFTWLQANARETHNVPVFVHFYASFRSLLHEKWLGKLLKMRLDCLLQQMTQSFPHKIGKTLAMNCATEKQLYTEQGSSYSTQSSSENNQYSDNGNVSMSCRGHVSLYKCYARRRKLNCVVMCVVSRSVAVVPWMSLYRLCSSFYIQDQRELLRRSVLKE